LAAVTTFFFGTALGDGSGAVVRVATWRALSVAADAAVVFAAARLNERIFYSDVVFGACSDTISTPKKVSFEPTFSRVYLFEG
jgi:hypothetical protein